jgi:hypothetical protein
MNKNLESFGVQELNAMEMEEIEGGLLFGLVCITGVLDGIKGNTEFHWFEKC